MMVSPKWQTMWMDSQYCSKSIVNLCVPSQQTKKILEDLKTNCSSPNKAIQLEALRCWGTWINNQNPEDWKLNTVCYTAVRPLHGKKLQPLYKDDDVCKLKLSLMWRLIFKVQSIVQLEGPQYIIETFLQFCLTWLSSTDKIDDNISILIFQLILSLLQKEESWSICDEESFPPLTTEIMTVKKVFQNYADKLSSLFIYSKKVTDKCVILKIWKCFLKNCEQSRENIPTPIWHKIFKILAQICSEDTESLKDRLGFLHGCATTLKTVLPSSKFIDYGNLLITPCEALLKKLVDLCVVQCEELCSLDMFTLSQEISKVLLSESIKIDGYEQCLFVMNVLEDFSSKSLFWGVWCGLVHCYQTWLEGIEKSHYTKIQMKFFRKLRSITVNYDLDYKYLHKDCLAEVESLIKVLNVTCISCATSEKSLVSVIKDVRNILFDGRKEIESNVDPQNVVAVPQTFISGQFSPVAVYSKPVRSNLPPVMILKIDLVKDILKISSMNQIVPLFNMFNFRFLTLKMVKGDVVQKSFSLQVEKSIDCDGLNVVKQKKLVIADVKTRNLNTVAICEKKTQLKEEYLEEAISTPITRSRRRAKEDLEKELEETPRKRRRKSFEIVVQEIFEKNKLRKTEKNTRKKSPINVNKKEKRKIKKTEEEKEESSCFKRQLRNSNANEGKKGKEEKTKTVTDRRLLDHYFKVITKKPVNGMKNVHDKEIKKNKKTEPSVNKKEVCWKQTSLKTIMNPKENSQILENGIKSCQKISKTAGNIKSKKEKKVVEGKDLAKLSPYKEVLHDHEYAKMEPESAKELDPVVTGDVKHLEEKNISTIVIKNQKVDLNDSVDERKPLIEVQQLGVSEIVKKVEVQMVHTEDEPLKLTSLLEEKETEDNLKNLQDRIAENQVTDVTETTLKKEQVKELEPSQEKNTDLESSNDLNGSESKPSRGKKRSRTLNNLKPNKKIKLDFEEKEMEIKDSTVSVLEEEKSEDNLTTLNIAEKENNLEKILPSKVEEKELQSILKVKGDASPKAVNGTISSRALRMIALVPESTMLGQVHREPSCKTEVSKNKKAPNVNKNSRASKMLALLSGNVVKEIEEVMEADDQKLEEPNSATKQMTTTPTIKTPTSTLKSPNSIKKRKSIMFDDAKNETVLYGIDTPPSKIHEERKKFQTGKLQEAVPAVTS